MRTKFDNTSSEWLYTALHHKWGQKPEGLMVIQIKDNIRDMY